MAHKQLVELLTGLKYKIEVVSRFEVLSRKVVTRVRARRQSNVETLSFVRFPWLDRVTCHCMAWNLLGNSSLHTCKGKYHQVNYDALGSSYMIVTFILVETLIDSKSTTPTLYYSVLIGCLLEQKVFKKLPQKASSSSSSCPLGAPTHFQFWTPALSWPYSRTTTITDMCIGWDHRRGFGQA